MLVTLLPFSSTYADTVPGENGKIAFTSNRDGNDEVYVMDADGTNQVNITNNPANDHSPAWSPDGSKLVFVSDRDGNNELYTMNPDGSEVVRITDNTFNDIEPTWSPDGTRFAFARSGDFGTEIYTMNSDGTEEVAITSNFVDDTHPSWSPDGTRIAVRQYVAGTQANIHIVNADGSNGMYLPNVGSTTSEYPNWSPDGSRILFSGNRTGDMEVFVSDVDETVAANQTNLTNLPSANDSQPSWSPDSTMITFVSNRNGNNDIFVMNSDGSNQVALTTDAASDTMPVWQPLQQVGPPVDPPAPAPTPAEPVEQGAVDAERLAETGTSVHVPIIIAALLSITTLALMTVRRYEFS